MCKYEILADFNLAVASVKLDHQTALHQIFRLYAGAYPGFTIGGFLAVARKARTKSLATTPIFRPRPLINDRRKDGNRLLDPRRF